MVGIVIVAHSQELAEGVRAMAAQMSAQNTSFIAAAGGLEDGSLGTSLERIQRAFEAAYSDDGVLILMDLGSAVMTTQIMVEMLPPERRERVRLSNAPLVEGAIAATVAAAQGENLQQVQRAAEGAARMSKIGVEATAVSRADVVVPVTGAVWCVELPVTNRVGLHARPAASFVRTAARFASRITVQNITHDGKPVDAKSMVLVLTQAAARQGERIRISATGTDAQEAIVALGALVQSGFGEA